MCTNFARQCRINFGDFGGFTGDGVAQDNRCDLLCTKIISCGLQAFMRSRNDGVFDVGKQRVSRLRCLIDLASDTRFQMPQHRSWRLNRKAFQNRKRLGIGARVGTGWARRNGTGVVACDVADDQAGYRCLAGCC